MKKAWKLSEIIAALADHVKKLHDLAGQISQLENRLSGLIQNLHNFDPGSDKAEEIPANYTPLEPVNPENNTTTGVSSNIIPFPGPGRFTNNSAGGNRNKYGLNSSPILARPGMPLPSEITDFRSALQRDGLILLAWDKRITETGDRYTAYWVTSTGTARYYASKTLALDEFSSALPDHKSYAAEDGIEYYGQEAPAYLVHVAPELMKSNPRHRELRILHIKTLRRQGSNTDFDYTYILTKEKCRNLPFVKSKGKEPSQAGA